MESYYISRIRRFIRRGILCISVISWVTFARISVQAKPEVSQNSTVFLLITRHPLFSFAFGTLPELLFGDDVYCREGSQGPCKQGNVFVNYGDSGPQFEYPYMDNHNGYPIWISLYGYHHNGGYDDKDCFPKVSLPNNVTVLNQTGTCIRADPEDPCQGYPATFKFLIFSAMCLPGDELAESCRENNQAFYEWNDTMVYCDCKTETELYWPETDKCYQMNSQGPCDEGQWIVLDSDGHSKCEETTCLADGSHVHLKDPVDGLLGCYRLDSQGYCQSYEKLNRMQVHPEVIQCSDTYIHVEPASSADKADTRKCPAGSKLHFNGHCKIIYNK